MPYLLEPTYHDPTQIVFRPNSFAKLGSLVPADAEGVAALRRRLMKGDGVYNQVIAALAGREVVEIAGVEPNPTLETLSVAVNLAKGRIDFILGVGGGGLGDGAKYIACAALYDGDGWDIVSGRHAPGEALPVAVVLTLPATGSESNPAAVVTRKATHEKRVFYVPPARPRLARADPEVMASLPRPPAGKRCRRCSSCMSASECLTYPVGALVQDGYAEAVVGAEDAGRHLRAAPRKPPGSRT